MKLPDAASYPALLPVPVIHPRHIVDRRYLSSPTLQLPHQRSLCSSDDHRIAARGFAARSDTGHTGTLQQARQCREIRRLDTLFAFLSHISPVAINII